MQSTPHDAKLFEVMRYVYYVATTYFLIQLTRHRTTRHSGTSEQHLQSDDRNGGPLTVYTETFQSISLSPYDTNLSQVLRHAYCLAICYFPLQLIHLPSLTPIPPYPFPLLPFSDISFSLVSRALSLCTGARRQLDVGR